MVFSSLPFLFLFLPIVLAAYFLLPGVKAKNAVLIAASLIFYAWGEPVYVFLMIGMAAANWGFGILTERFSPKVICTLAVIFDLACLGVFKYAGFVVQNVNRLAGTQLPVPSIALPIGISFYTFQILSYVIDVTRKKVGVQQSFWKFLLYVSLFPQLIAGPIVRYSDVEPQLSEREIDLESVFYGAFRFCIGLGKKVLLADYAGKAAGALLDGTLAAQSTLGVWFGVLLFMFEIYFDFSGYSDMAIGLGRIFGFKYPENFNLPYCARSITDFWRRWHISLSTFFRDYVYIPLGGNRKHVYLNLFIVWALTGLWHGASWNFVFWGLYFFVILTVERLLKAQISRIPRAVAHVVTLFLILLGWNIFYHTDTARLLQSFGVMFGASGAGFTNHQTGITILNSLPLVLACAVGASPLPRMVGNTFSMFCTTRSHRGRRQTAYVLVLFFYALVVLALSVIALTGSTFNAFLYFRF